MRKRLKPGIIAAALASLLISGFTTRLDAQERCTNASLNGSYAFKVDGTNVANPYLPFGPFAAVGKNTYDGRGHMNGVITVSSNGSIILCDAAIRRIHLSDLMDMGAMAFKSDDVIQIDNADQPEATRQRRAKYCAHPCSVPAAYALMAPLRSEPPARATCIPVDSGKGSR